MYENFANTLDFSFTSGFSFAIDRFTILFKDLTVELCQINFANIMYDNLVTLLLTVSGLL